MTSLPSPFPRAAISLANGARPTASWRIVANFGREPRTGRGMPQSWGADGGRLPIRIEVDVSTAPSTAPGAADGELTIRPRDPLIRYTDFIDGDLRTTTGEKVHPVRPGGWTLDGNKLSFWLEFPQVSYSHAWRRRENHPADQPLRDPVSPAPANPPTCYPATPPPRRVATSTRRHPAVPPPQRVNTPTLHFATSLHFGAP